MNVEQEILKRIKKSKTREGAFRLLIKTYKQPLYGQLRSLLGNHSDADDALQNTFIKVWNHIDGFKGDSSLYTWLYRIARNEGLTLLKKNRRITTTDVRDDAAIANEHLGPDGEEIQLKLKSALATLPEKQKEVFNLKYFGEMKYEEIAEITGTSIGALKASYFHAVRKIEDFLTSR